MNKKKISECICGSKAKFYKRRVSYARGEYSLVGWVECHKCGFSISPRIIDGSYGIQTTADDVIEIWNRVTVDINC